MKHFIFLFPLALALTTIGCGKALYSSSDGDVTGQGVTPLITDASKVTKLEYHVAIGAHMMAGTIVSKLVIDVNVAGQAARATRILFSNSDPDVPLKNCVYDLNLTEMSALLGALSSATVQAHQTEGPQCVDGGYSTLSLTSSSGTRVYPFEGCDIGISGRVIVSDSLRPHLSNLMKNIACSYP